MIAVVTLHNANDPLVNIYSTISQEQDNYHKPIEYELEIGENGNKKRCYMLLICIL